MISRFAVLAALLVTALPPAAAADSPPGRQRRRKLNDGRTRQAAVARRFRAFRRPA
jgi:hypothetical protein